MLYALGIGMGSDPLNERELQFVNEAFATPKPLKVVPDFCVGLRLGGRGPESSTSTASWSSMRTRHHISQADACHG